MSLAAPALARRQLRGVCIECPEPQLQTALLVTSELVTNAVLHGQADDGATPDGQRLLLSIQLDGDDLRVEVTDLNEIVPRLSPVAEDSEDGRGLHIVAELATAWGTLPARPGRGKTVWVELHL